MYLNFILQCKIYGPGCFWDINSIENGHSLLGAEDSGKGEFLVPTKGQIHIIIKKKYNLKTLKKTYQPKLWPYVLIKHQE